MKCHEEKRNVRVQRKTMEFCAKEQRSAEWEVIFSRGFHIFRDTWGLKGKRPCIGKDQYLQFNCVDLICFGIRIAMDTTAN